MTPPDLRIRPGRPADAPAFAAFAARVFRETYAAQNERAELERYVGAHFTEARQAAELADPAVATLLAESGGALVAYAQLHLGKAADGVERIGGDAAFLARFYVDHAWHGRGVAQALMDATEDEARRRGVAVLWLSVWKENPRAIAFYRRRGFEVWGEMPFLFGTDLQEDWLMALELTAAVSSRPP